MPGGVDRDRAGNDEAAVAGEAAAGHAGGLDDRYGTRRVEAALLLTAMAGSDAADPATAEADKRRTDYVAALDANALKGARIGATVGVGENWIGYVILKSRPTISLSL